LDNIPLKALVIDLNSASADLLVDSLKSLKENVLTVYKTTNTKDTDKVMKENDVNTIFIDPISVGLEQASEFIFAVRKAYPSIVFVLYVDFEIMERGRIGFYAGDRSRFKHYYKLNKGIPSLAFRTELQTLVSTCQRYLNYSLTKDKIAQLQQELNSLGKNSSQQVVAVPADLIEKIEEQLSDLNAMIAQSGGENDVVPKSVFLSYRFAETEYIQGLRTLLEREGFLIFTGENSNTFISQAILERIKKSEFFLCLMTRADEKKDGTYTTSPWLLEEKGAALALSKKLVMMVEDGVNDIGGLQGDWQRIHFSPKSFTSAVIRAIDQLKSYGA
jgi:hypothetical protein